MSLDLFLEYEFLQRALLAGVVVAALAGLLGVFLVLRQWSLLGDGLAHVSFGGVAIALAAGVYPLGFAILFAVAGGIAIHVLRERRIVHGDTAIGILFTAGLATGILVASATRGFGVDVDAYLFGNILAIEDQDLYVVLGVGAALVLLLAAFFKEFFSMTFSEEAALVTGLPVRALNLVFVALSAATIVVASRIVGVLLVSALIVVPAAASLQVARSFRGALATSVALGIASALAGMVVAVEMGWSTGATIALASIALFLASLAAGRAR
ncbi:MAG TPA: metal ABC transporter permease, partial [Candidatus Thermoplasmatota archaeon]|nr:metal ABC transporter permease [Candidatus Thermoplasmatota archaeon]